MESLGRSLNVCAQKLSLGLVWKELQVFSKLLYRGRNQHRRDKCFQRLIRVYSAGDWRLAVSVDFAMCTGFQGAEGISRSCPGQSCQEVYKVVKVRNL